MLLPLRPAHSQFGVQGSGFRIQDSGFRVQSSGLKVWDTGSKVSAELPRAVARVSVSRQAKMYASFERRYCCRSNR